jgi:hypothetical protein
MLGFKDFSQDLDHVLVLLGRWKFYFQHIIPKFSHYLIITLILSFQRVTFIQNLIGNNTQRPDIRILVAFIVYDHLRRCIVCCSSTFPH